MKMHQVKQKAKKLGIKPGNISKLKLIREIQMVEGNTPCYGTSDGNCPQTKCCFMDDCYLNSNNN